MGVVNNQQRAGSGEGGKIPPGFVLFKGNSLRILPWDEHSP